MREPFDLGAPLPADDQDRELVESKRHRRGPAEVIEKVEHALPKDRTAQKRIIGTAEPHARHLQDLLSEGLLLLVQLFDGGCGNRGSLAVAGGSAAIGINYDRHSQCGQQRT